MEPQGMNQLLEVKKSDINGQGLFAGQDFSSDEEIMKFEGNPPIVIYINHSCIPNAYVYQPNEEDMQTHVLYSNGIKKGEEITFDYRIGKLYLDQWNKFVEGHCNCPKCRRL